MKTNVYHADHIVRLLRDSKIATIEELKKAIGTKSYITVYRKLNELNYLSSCSHSGKYYTLMRFVHFNNKGLWLFNSVLFSSYGTLAETIKALTEKSEQGLTAIEIEELLKVKPNEALLKLVKSKCVYREKVSGIYIYFSNDKTITTQQKLCRKDLYEKLSLGILNPNVLKDEVKAALLIFYSLLDEKQRRLYIGLESLKLGIGGDKVIAEMLGVNIKTVKKGRQELLNNEINLKTVRSAGGGRKAIKKNPKYNIQNRKTDGI